MGKAMSAAKEKDMRKRIVQKFTKEQDRYVDALQSAINFCTGDSEDLEDVIDRAHELYLTTAIVWCIDEGRVPADYLPYLDSPGCSLEEILTGFEDDIEERYMMHVNHTAYDAIANAVHWYKMEQEDFSEAIDAAQDEWLKKNGEES